MRLALLIPVYIMIATAISAPSTAFAASPTDVTALAAELALHFQANEVSIAPEASQTGTRPDGTPYITMLTTDFLAFAVMVYPSDADAKRELLRGRGKLKSIPGGMGRLSLAQNGNLLISVMALSPSMDQEPQTQTIIDAFTAFKAR